MYPQGALMDNPFWRFKRPVLLRIFTALVVFFTVSAAFAQNRNVDLVAAARAQIGKTVIYDSQYVRLTYPQGDVPIDRGVCTDVIIRALREARKMDLQQLINEDMKVRFEGYPKNWALKKPDSNIDHRRVPNLQTYFQKYAKSMKPSNKPEDYQGGDIVTSLLPGNLPHIMIVSDKTTANGVPLVIHNIGRGTQEEDELFSYPLTGHYRLRAQ
jgi:uncharacterized protein